MTIIELIEKLKQEVFRQMEAGKETNGAFEVLRTWYNEMLTLNPAKMEMFDRCYNNIYGLIWGLKAAYYITQDEKDQLLEELTQISNRFYDINDHTP